MKLLLAAAVVLGFANAYAQQPVFSSRTNAVRVDVLATRDGRLLRGLGESDFEVRDNGVLQQATVLSTEELPLNVILALDRSDSISGSRLAELQSAGRAVLDGLRDRDGAAVVTFGSAVTAPPRLTLDLDAPRAALLRPAAGGRTALIDACFAGLMLGTSEVGRSLMLVFSDGLDTASWLTADAVIRSARHADVVTHAVVSGDKSRQAFLRQLTDTTGGDLLEVKNIKDVAAAFQTLLGQYRQRYLLSYTPTGVGRAGWHKIDVRVKQANVVVRARSGYLHGPW